MLSAVWIGHVGLLLGCCEQLQVCQLSCGWQVVTSRSGTCSKSHITCTMLSGFPLPSNRCVVTRRARAVGADQRPHHALCQQHVRLSWLMLEVLRFNKLSAGCLAVHEGYNQDCLIHKHQCALLDAGAQQGPSWACRATSRGGTLTCASWVYSHQRAPR